jgi:hypothetical protein
MADKSFGVKNINLIGAGNTATIESTNNLNINAGTVAISTDLSIGGEVSSNVIVGSGYSVGIGSTLPTSSVDVNGTVTALNYIGTGDALTGIVTQIAAGIGITLTSTQSEGKGKVTIESYFPIGKTIFVTTKGSDDNTGLDQDHAKATIEAAAAIAFAGDTIKVAPGVYKENNPIRLKKGVSIEGAELRNCVIQPKFSDRDLIQVNNSCHITDLSYTSSSDMTNGAAVIAFEPLAGVSSDRFFDAARTIRQNLDFIAREATEYIKSSDYSNTVTLNASETSAIVEDIKKALKSTSHDITRGGNSKCVGAGKSHATKYTDSSNVPNLTNYIDESRDALHYSIGIARSCVNNITWNGGYQSEFTQIKDLSIQADPSTGSNSDYGSCANVNSAISVCVGIITSIIQNKINGVSVTTGITTTFPANAGLGTDSIIGITSAVYDKDSGATTLVAPNFSVKKGDVVEVRELQFECNSGSGISTQAFPSGKNGFLFDVTGVAGTTFTVNTGISTLAHTYVGGGFVVNRAIGVTTAQYDAATGIATITAPGAQVSVGDFVTIHDLEFSCAAAHAGVTTTFYPSGKNGYEFRVTQVIGAGTTFVTNVGINTIEHTYESGGFVFPQYGPGVGPISQGPYVRNCTNFIPKSIGMKIDGFNAEVGDEDDIGVTGSMSVDSYTQFNQAGIGVSITNSAYAQLVSIFTICDETGIFVGSGGQCDITNSNSSFGTFGLVSDGVGDAGTKSSYRYTGVVNAEALLAQDTIKISGVGSIRPYNGQALFFDELYYEIESVTMDNKGTGYSSTNPPIVTISAPGGPNGITAEASANVNVAGQVTSIDINNNGSQYRLSDSITFTVADPTSGVTATIDEVKLKPLYYTIESATLPSAGITTVVLNTNLNNTVGVGSTAYFNRLSLQITSSHSFEWVGSGTDIDTAKPALGGVVIQANEVVKRNGGEVIYTSTDQAGNFKIGDDLTINQLTGTISGRSFDQSILNKVTPLIIALGK